MSTMATGCTLGDLLADEQLGLTLLVDRPEARSRPVRGARLVLGHGLDLDAVSEDHVLVILEPSQGVDGLLSSLIQVADASGARIVAFRRPPGVPTSQLEKIGGRHVLLELPADADLAGLISGIGRATAVADEFLARRLTSLQRSLGRVLAAPVPLQALTRRVAQICNAVVTIVHDDGTNEFPTAPLPLSLLFPEIGRSDEEAQRFALNGWYGMAVKVAVPRPARDGSAWLLVASRRENFPDSYSTAAIYIAASLAETSMQIDLAALRQERAVRSAILEQALALRLERHDAELTGRIASLGIGFDQEARVIVIEPVRSLRNASVLENLYEAVQRALAEDGIPHLMVLRENALVGLLQASAAAIRRTFIKTTTGARDFLLGIGRDSTGVGHLLDSYHDAQLAVRVLRRDNAVRPSMCYEDFDFAMRLFSDVGLDKMSEWANDLLRPLEDKQTMLVTLSTYFEHHQNIMEAAEALAVHHNSLRYRLAKIESTLRLNLRDPSAVSSLFLALTALSMAETEKSAARALAPRSRTQAPGGARSAPAAGAVLSESGQGLSDHFGAAVGPER